MKRTVTVSNREEGMMRMVKLGRYIELLTAWLGFSDDLAFHVSPAHRDVPRVQGANRQGLQVCRNDSFC